MELLGFVLLSPVVGFAWGRRGAFAPLRLPELLQMLVAPLWMGLLGVLGSGIVFAPRLLEHGPWRDHLETLSLSSLLLQVVKMVLACFGAGVVLGLPAVLGWAVGYRKV